MVTIAICAVVCGADGWTEVEAFGKIKKKGIMVERQADYPFALKKNQKGLAEDVLTLYEGAHRMGFADLQHDHLGKTSHDYHCALRWVAHLVLCLMDWPRAP